MARDTRYWAALGVVLALGSIPWWLPLLGVDLGSPRDGRGGVGPQGAFALGALVWSSCALAAVAFALSLVHVALDRGFAVAALVLPLLGAAALDVAFGARLLALPVDGGAWGSQGWVVSRATGALAWIVAAAAVLRRRDGAGPLVASAAAVLLLSGAGLAAMALPELRVAGDRPEAALLVHVLLGVTLLPKLARAGRGPLTGALPLAVVAAIAAQLSMGIGSRRAFDHHFLAAHGLLVLTAVIVLAGVIGECLRSHRRRLLEETLPHRAASAVATAPDGDGAVAAAVDVLGEAIGWPVGHVWRVEDGAEPVTVSIGRWRLPAGRKLTPFRDATKELRCAPGVDLPGRVLLWGKGAWVTDLREDAACPRAQAARACHVAGALAVPIGARGEVRLVAELLSLRPEPVDDRLLSLLDRAAAEVGRALDVRRTSNGSGSPGIVVSDALVAHVSHGLRTPLSSAMGVTSLLQESSLDEQQAASVRTVRQSMDALLHSVDEFVDYLRSEAGDLELDDGPFVLDEVLGELSGAVVDTAGVEAVQLELERDGSLPAHLRGDGPRLRRLLVSLVGQAARATRGGRLRLRATADGRTETAVTLRVEVVGCAGDDGLGEAWTSSADESAAGGTGLGLAVARRLVERMGGRTGRPSDGPDAGALWFAVELAVADEPVPALDADADAHAVDTDASAAVEPGAPGPDAGARPDGGTSAAERPAASQGETASRDAEAALPSPRPPSEAAPAPRGHILVVEDNVVNQAVARRLLERMGHDVDVASDGGEAVAAAKSTAFDLILMDYQMPVMDGYEATVAIRELPGEVARTPIVAMTAKTMKGDREMCLAAGMDDYIAKPVSPKVLQKVVEHWLERVQARRPSRFATAAEA